MRKGPSLSQCGSVKGEVFLPSWLPGPVRKHTAHSRQALFP